MTYIILFNIFLGYFMKIDLLRDYGKKETVEIDSAIGELDIKNEDFKFDHDIHVLCILHRDIDLIRIDGKVKASAVMECSRCLDSFRRDIVGDFSFVVRHLKNGETVPETSRVFDNEGDDGLLYISNDKDSIDISKFVREALLLSIPQKPVCKEDCKGLCPVCGTNLNEGKCGCARTGNDPRWSALSGLF